ncbi:hypothetical protein CBER1_03277 [Cercospora berteroae]|uniref:Uncharacterized protein n=1 Tax=Cercospora berteroae TaxID=357750 RepID=A0A2S6C2C2_9PEZI|nr:hypothetical protein CBER1_03277 [Cercospora berteroae]
MSDQTSTITAYDSITTESRTITTSVAATTTIYGTTVTTTSTVTEPTITAYVFTSTATTVSTSTVTVTPTVTTTMTRRRQRSHVQRRVSHAPPRGTERFASNVNPSGTSPTGTLYNILGNGVAGENPIEYTYPNGTKHRYSEVALFNRQAPATLSIPTVACRYSGGRFSTCPMRCWWTGDGNETTNNSVSQGSIGGPWYLAKPGQVSQSTYPLYAVN